MPVDRSLPALQQIHEQSEDGEYTHQYLTIEGTFVCERARLVPTADGKGKVLVYEGEYMFVGDDGKVYETRYTASAEGGYKAEGDHLPVALKVPLPEAPKVEVPVAVPTVAAEPVV